MNPELQNALAQARELAAMRGFRHTGIYHLLWVVWKNQPHVLRGWLASYGAPVDVFIKMLETVLRPRRAGGGIARDRREAELLEEAIGLVRLREEKNGLPLELARLGDVFVEMSEDPLLSLCRRFDIPCRRSPT